MRVFFEALPAMQVNWSKILWLLAALTMILGNLAALVQENIKRMLAYSIIAHAGYLLIGMVAGKEMGTAGMLYYLLAYTFTNIGAFGIVALVGRKGKANVMLDDYRGLAKSHPLIALSMAIFLFSLAGIPPTAGLSENSPYSGRPLKPVIFGLSLSEFSPARLRYSIISE